MILALRTDSPDAVLVLHDGTNVVARDEWTANRTLARDLLAHITELMRQQSADWQDIAGIVAYHGPGSFTGLRIGLSVANSIAYARQCPIVGTTGEDWLESGIARLQNHETDESVMPFYGAEPRVTAPRK